MFWLPSHAPPPAAKGRVPCHPAPGHSLTRSFAWLVLTAGEHNPVLDETKTPVGPEGMVQSNVRGLRGWRYKGTWTLAMLKRLERPPRGTGAGCRPATGTVTNRANDGLR